LYGAQACRLAVAASGGRRVNNKARRAARLCLSNLLFVSNAREAFALITAPHSRASGGRKEKNGNYYSAAILNIEVKFVNLLIEQKISIMTVITIHPKDEAQEAALKTIFDGFNVRYEVELDETGYLMSSKANEIALDKSIKQAEEGDVVKIALDDLWK